MKARSAVTPVALVVLAVGAVSYAYFVDRGRVSDADRAARRRDVFPSFRVEGVRRVELVHGSEKLVLEREVDAGDAWVMAGSRRDAIDAAAVDALLRELEMATRVRDVQDGDAVGLGAPRVRGAVTIGPLEYRFVLGADAVAPEGAAYMSVEGEGAFVVGRSLKVQLLRGASAYRDRTFVPYGASEVARIEVRGQSGTGGFVLERHGTSFRVGGGAGLRASSAAVDRLFGAIADARAQMFLDDAATGSVGSEEDMAVAVMPRDSTRPPVRLLVGGACPLDGDAHEPIVLAGSRPVTNGIQDVVVARTEPSPMFACVDKALGEALAVSPDSLVDPSPLIAHADEIEELRIERVDIPGADGARVELARRGGGWHERAPVDRDLGTGDVDSANALAAALADARATGVRRAEPGDRFPVHARVTIVRTGAAASEVVETSVPDASGVVLARRPDDGAVMRLARTVAVRFEPHPIALDSHAVWAAPFDPAAVTVIDDSCTRATERLELQDGTWRTRAFDVDGRSAAELSTSFAHARAEAWVSEGDEGAFGFEREGSCAVMLTLQPLTDGGPPRRVGMIFGESGEGGVYARTLDGPGVFVVPVSLRAMASRPAVDRGRFRIDVATLTRLVLTRNGDKLVLSRPRPDDPIVRMDGEDAGPDDAIERALAALRADDTVHTGPPVREEGLDHPTLEIEATRRAEGGPPTETRIAIGALGAETREGATAAYFARIAGVDATFLVPRDVVDAILEAW